MKQPQQQRVRKEYDILAENYDARWRRYVDATLRETIDSLQLGGHECVLDVPIGTGELAVRLLEKWPKLRIAGVDLSPRMLEQATAKHALSDLELHEACVTGLPFPDGEFDCVFCVNSFHYFSDPQSSLREIRRVLRDGGRLILVDWCDDYLACKLCSFWLRIVDPAFHRTYSQRDCNALIRDAGFKDPNSRRFRVNWLWGMMRFEAH